LVQHIISAIIVWAPDFKAIRI